MYLLDSSPVHVLRGLVWAFLLHHILCSGSHYAWWQYHRVAGSQTWSHIEQEDDAAAHESMFAPKSDIKQHFRTKVEFATGHRIAGSKASNSSRATAQEPALLFSLQRLRNP